MSITFKLNILNVHSKIYCKRCFFCLHANSTFRDNSPAGHDSNSVLFIRRSHHSGQFVNLFKCRVYLSGQFAMLVYYDCEFYAGIFINCENIGTLFKMFTSGQYKKITNNQILTTFLLTTKY